MDEIYLFFFNTIRNLLRRCASLQSSIMSFDDTLSWVSAALRPDPLLNSSSAPSSAPHVMDWRRRLYSKEHDESHVADLLRRSDRDNSIFDIDADDSADELHDGQVVALLSFWMFHARSQNLHGGSTWLSIRSIDISGCNLEHNIMEIFFQGMIGTTPSLTSLDVSANQIGGYSDDDDFFIPILSPGAALASLLKDNNSITSLKASYCNMGMHAIHGLANALTNSNRSLTVLDVSANSLWWDEINVDELDSDRCFGTDAMYSIATMMEENHVLQNVKVSAAEFKPHRLLGRELFNNIRPANGSDSEKKEKEKEKDRDNLERISFGIGGNMGARASRSDLIIVMECLKSNPCVTSLSLSGLRVDHEAAESVARLIQQLPPKLVLFDLTKVQTPMKTSRVLADAVMANLHEQWRLHDEKTTKERQKDQRRSGFVKLPKKGCDFDWNPPGEDNFVVDKHNMLRTFSDIPVLRLCGGGPMVVTKLSLKGAGIGLHGAIVLSELLKRNNTVTHLYLSENNVGTRGCMVLGDAIYGVSQSVVFVDLRQNGIENKAMEHCGKVLRARLERGTVGDMGGNRPPPPLTAWDVQQNVIGGFGVSSELPGMNEYLEAMSDLAKTREVGGGVTVYLSGNQIRPTIAREMLAAHAGTKLKLFVDVRQ